MKLVIQTQVRENYGAHDWDGKGECPQYWKCKGGDTYIVPNLTDKQVEKVKSHGVPTLTALIESRSEGFEEYIIDVSVVEDNAVVCDEWETPFVLSWENNRWVARRTVENGEHGYMHQEIASKSEQYDMCMGGERENFKCAFLMLNGDLVPGDKLNDYFPKAA